MDIQEIQEFLPHRYPFLLIDRVIECEPGVRLLAIKNVTYNEPCFQGHFPHISVFPGVLILEALAQATGLLASRSDARLGKGMTYYLTSIDKARFKKTVVPGDQLMLEISFLRSVKNIWSFDCQAEVDGKFVAGAVIKCAAVVD